MKKLTKIQLELLRRFVNTFNVDINYEGKLISFENAVAILENEIPKTKTIKERVKDFEYLLAPYLDTYGSDMLNKFFHYWCQMDGTKLLFETRTTFNIKLRLEYWHNRKKENERKEYIRQLNNRF